MQAAWPLTSEFSRALAFLILTQEGQIANWANFTFTHVKFVALSHHGDYRKYNSCHGTEWISSESLLPRTPLGQGHRWQSKSLKRLNNTCSTFL